MDKKKTCCFIGPNQFREAEIQKLIEGLKRETEALAEQGVDTFISGYNKGFDWVAASMVIAIKEESYPNIRLIFIQPGDDFKKNLSREESIFFDKLFREADDVIYMNDLERGRYVENRARWLAEICGFCICCNEKDEVDMNMNTINIETR